VPVNLRVIFPNNRHAGLDPIELFTLSLAILAAFQLIAMVFQAIYMRDQLGAMHRQLEAYDRPWLTASIAFFDQREDGDPISFDVIGNAFVALVVTFKNIGKSVATEIRVTHELMALESGTTRAQLKQLLMEMRRPEDPIGFTLFPDEETAPRLWEDIVSKARIDAVLFDGSNNGGRSFKLALMVAIFYKFSTSKSWHETRFSCLIGVDRFEHELAEALRMDGESRMRGVVITKQGGDIAT
jgi:hypothetical protein